MLLPNLCSLRERSNAELDGATSPCGRLSRPRTTTAAPPRPARSAVGAPIPGTGRMPVTRGDATRWFPCSLWFARRRRSPTVSQRPRHAYAAGFRRGLPDRQMKTSPGVLAASVYSETHRVRPRSARFEPVSKLKDVTTPVPRVLLSATLAGPGPSGSTGHVPALSGLLLPSPAPPGAGCPQLQRPAATGHRRRSLTSTRTTAPHGAANQVDRFRIR